MVQGEAQALEKELHLGHGPQDHEPAQLVALIAGRDFVTPDDVKSMALPALRHRVMPAPELEIEGQSSDMILKALIERVEAPRK